ncbi:MAG: D-glycero-beta-D-manno-heptose 1,7-bisphosphate 7-phosphatase [archaeon]
MNKAVFLDRDGTINEEKNYLSREEDFKFIPGTIEGLKLLREKGFKLIVVTNQSGIGRGFVEGKQVERINKKMKEELKEEEVELDAVYVCPHTPEEGCDCRKPKNALVKIAEKEFKLDLKKSFFVGDKTIDIQLGKNCNGRTILLKTGYGGSDKKFKVKPDYIAEDLRNAAEIILSEEK